jgi:hypothetical protein
VRTAAPTGRRGLPCKRRGVADDQLRNQGLAKDFSDGKDIVMEALITAGAAPARNASRYAPNPVDLRARLLDTAATGQQEIAARLALVKSIALNLERFVQAAGDSDTPADARGTAPSDAR